MATPAEIDAQVRLERDQISQGYKKLHKNTQDLESRSYASSSVYGVASIEMLLPCVVRRLEETRTRLTKGQAGIAFKEIHQYIFELEPLAVATIALKLTFDKVFSWKEGSDQLSAVCEAIGSAVEAECQMRFYEREAPGLLQTLKKLYWHSASGTHQRLVNIRRPMNTANIVWKPWGVATRTKLGCWLLDCIIAESHWFTKEARRQGRNKTVNFVVPTPEFISIKDKIMKDAEMFSPLAWPMLIEPNDWSHDRVGGYLLNEVMRGHPMIRRGNPLPKQGEIPFEFLNRIQKTAFTLNPFTVGVAEELERLERQVGKFLPIVNHELPPKPVDIAENADSRKKYRQAAAQTMNLNAQEFKKSCRTRMTMEAVRRFKDVPKFYIPWSFDYRGRAYPIPSFLTPQDTDFGKSLLVFAEGSYMTPEAEEWLAFQVATTFGLDKAPMSERLEWARANHELFTLIAQEPIENQHLWENADEPWQFLAAAEEYYHCVVIADRQFTRHMVATDATCSGLQILAGLARDKSTAQLVNVLPGDKPQDAYKVIAETAKPHVPASVRDHMDRKVTKRTVMTVPYNAKPFSNRGYIREALKEKGVEVSKEDLTDTVKAVRDAMDAVVPGPMAVMAWIEKEVANAIKAGKQFLEWRTPSGFIVHQKLNKKKVQTLELQLLGRCRVKVAEGDTDEVDLNHHKNATAPNLIHSLDASLLHLTVPRFDAPIALIHDSVLCRATDMSTLSSLVRETYMHLFAEHDYLRDFAAQIGASSEPPIIGDLKPESVIESTYFFC